jgi:hypothetical protein
MEKEKKPDRCPLCGNESKPLAKSSRADKRTRVAMLRSAPKISGDSLGAESSDDKTANNFAEFGRNGSNEQGG